MMEGHIPELLEALQLLYKSCDICISQWIFCFYDVRNAGDTYKHFIYSKILPVQRIYKT
jgi:hypothetical protein